MAKWLTAWRNAPETAWLAEGPVHPQQQVLRRLEAAYRRFFEAAKAGKAGLNRGILDAAWGEFTRQLAYKVQWRGGCVILVDPAYTSRTCRVCAHEAADNRRTQSLFSCVACGHTENADVHAAKNILARATALFEAEDLRLFEGEQRTAAGHAAAACGGVVRRAAPERHVRALRAAPSKQEPAEAEIS
jgi:putative transposase